MSLLPDTYLGRFAALATIGSFLLLIPDIRCALVSCPGPCFQKQANFWLFAADTSSSPTPRSIYGGGTIIPKKFDETHMGFKVGSTVSLDSARVCRDFKAIGSVDCANQDFVTGEYRVSWLAGNDGSGKRAVCLKEK